MLVLVTPCSLPEQLCRHQAHPEVLTASDGTSNVMCAQRGREAAGLGPVEVCVGVMGAEKGLALGTILVRFCLSPGGILKSVDQVLITWKSEASRNGADSSVKTLSWRLVGRWSSRASPQLCVGFESVSVSL